MTTFNGLRIPGLLLVLLGTTLVGCGGGDDSSSPTPPPAQTPPPPPPPTTPSLPPLSSTVISLDDHHQVGETHWGDGATSTGGQGQAVGTLECTATAPVGYHEHAHLSIFLNGEALAIPRAIGFPGANCEYPVHTHDYDGVIHLHATAQTTFTLGQFFAIWGREVSATNVADLTGMPVRVFITDDGVVSEATGDFTTVEMLPHREITIQVGTDIAEIPNFTWSY